MVKIFYTLNVSVGCDWFFLFYFILLLCIVVTMYVHLSFFKLRLCPLDA